ncbi:MAG: molybdenum transporter, periplasmic molybdate-binding protein [Oscillospiraceae bacterium]|jgi:molybdate transport system substrate-binding protein|nr:molybdenum transporter, periplasmic molybdate-binding protein [Oscillospiraceae bacterium]
MRQKNKKWTALFATLSMAAMVMAGCSPTNNENSSSGAPSTASIEISVSAAASLTDVMAEIQNNYKTVVPNVKLTFSFGSSGALQTQIEEGAPADVFFSAATKQMDALAQKDLVLTDTKVDLLENKVVLIKPSDSKIDLKSFNDIEKDTVKKVAMGDPASVPVGQYSQEVLTSLKIYDKVKSKFVLGSDVRQVLSWVETGDVDCGAVYATDAATTKEVSVVCEAPEGSYKKAIYPVAALKSSKNADAAKAFIEYLQKPEVLSVFEKYGFNINK